MLPNIIGNEGIIRKIYGAVLEGMQYAHKQGIIHRDLKPANILLNSDDDVVISDFGLGRSMEALTSRATETGNKFGTLGYAAPEQFINAKKANSHADVFSLGRILYELYTGENPSVVPDLSKVPPEVALIVERCTNTNPSQRFQSATELRLAFTNIWVVSGKKTIEGTIKHIIAKSLAKDYLKSSEIRELSNCISQCKDDVDLMHEICVKLPGTVFSSLWTENYHVITHVVKVFTDQVTNQNWPFNYVDTIGNSCVKIFNSIENPKIRALIIYAIVEVSVSHNRWGVMDQAAELLMAANSAAEDIAVADALKPIAYHLIELKDRLNISKLGPNVADLLYYEEE